MERKSKGGRLWSRVSGQSLPYVNDVFQRKEPTKLELIQSCNDTAFACVSHIYDTVAKLSFPLYRESDNANKRKKSKLPEHRDRYVEEVSRHPLLDLLHRPNPMMSFRRLIQTTQAYLDTCGDAFWYLKRDLGNKIYQIWLLESHLVTVKQEGTELPQFFFGFDQNEAPYTWDDIIYFQSDPDLFSPYTRSNCPLKAVYDRVITQMLETGFVRRTLENEARPQAMLSFGESISPGEAKRVAEQFVQQLGGRRTGGLFVPDVAGAKIEPIQWQVQDFAQLQLFQTVKESICDSFHFPIDLLRPGQANRSAAEAAAYNYLLYCIAPRVDNIMATLNHRLAPMFDEHLFFEATNLDTQDKAFELQKKQVLLQFGVITREEAREEENYPSATWATEPLIPAGAIPADQFDNVQPQQQPDTSKAKSFRPQGHALEEAIRKFFRLQKASILTMLKHFDLEQVTTKSVLHPDDYSKEKSQWKNLPADNAFDLSAYTEEMVREFNPLVQLYANNGASNTLTKLKLTPDSLAVTQPKIDEAVAAQTYKFCAETNATTELALSDAIAKLKEEIAEGLIQGDTRPLIAERVSMVFNRAEVLRAGMIAATESSRAMHAAQLLVAKDSGLNIKKKWLLSSDACAKCKEIMARKPIADLDEPFTITDYGAVQAPPAHVFCRCSYTEIVE